MSLSDKNRIIRAIGKGAKTVQKISAITKLTQETVFTILELYNEIFLRSKIDSVQTYGLTEYGKTLLPKKKTFPKLPMPHCYIERINQIRDVLIQAGSPLATRQIADIFKEKRVDMYHFLAKNKEVFEQVGKLKKDSLWQAKKNS